MLEDMRAAFEARQGRARAGALFRAFRYCGDRAIPLPKWAVQAFGQATDEWFSLKVGSLDEAFGTAPITKKRLALLRGRRRLMLRVHLEVFNARRAKKAIDWNALAETLGASKTTLQEIFYSTNVLRLNPISRKKKKKSGMNGR